MARGAWCGRGPEGHADVAAPPRDRRPASAHGAAWCPATSDLAVLAVALDARPRHRSADRRAALRRLSVAKPVQEANASFTGSNVACGVGVIQATRTDAFAMPTIQCQIRVFCPEERIDTLIPGRSGKNHRELRGPHGRHGKAQWTELRRLRHRGDRRHQIAATPPDKPAMTTLVYLEHHPVPAGHLDGRRGRENSKVATESHQTSNESAVGCAG